MGCFFFFFFYVYTHSFKPFSSVQFSRSVVSNSLQPHELQHARPPCPSPTPGDHPNSRPSSRYCNLIFRKFLSPQGETLYSLALSISFTHTAQSWANTNLYVSVDFTVLDISYEWGHNTWSFVMDFSRLAQRFQGSHMLQHVSVLHSFL